MLVSAIMEVMNKYGVKRVYCADMTDVYPIGTAHYEDIEFKFFIRLGALYVIDDTFKIARAVASVKNIQNTVYSVILNHIIGDNKNSMGLVDESIKNNSKYKKALVNYNNSFKDLQKFNKWFAKKYKKEIRKFDRIESLRLIKLENSIADDYFQKWLDKN